MSQHSSFQAQQYDREDANNTFIPERRLALSMPQHPSPGAQPTSTILYNMDKQVGYLDHHISELEQLADRLAPGCLFATRGAFMTKVTFFRITKPTSTPCGVDLANRVLTVQFKVRKLFNETTLEPLIAFAERQSRLMVETANMHIDVGLIDLSMLSTPRLTRVMSCRKPTSFEKQDSSRDQMKPRKTQGARPPSRRKHLNRRPQKTAISYTFAAPVSHHTRPAC